MGIFNWIGIGGELAKPIEAASKLYTTDKERLYEENKREGMLTHTVDKQIHLNEILAGSNRLFTSGWQPLIGWTSGFLILLYYAPQIIIADVIWAKLCLSHGTIMPFPIKSDDIMQLIYLLMGFGIYHIANKKINN